MRPKMLRLFFFLSAWLVALSLPLVLEVALSVAAEVPSARVMGLTSRLDAAFLVGAGTAGVGAVSLVLANWPASVAMLCAG